MVPGGEFVSAEKFVLLVDDAGSGLHSTLEESLARVFSAEALGFLLLVGNELLHELLGGALRDVSTDVVGFVGLGERVPVLVAYAVDELAAARRDLLIQVALELLFFGVELARLLRAQDGCYGHGYSLGAGPTPR